MRVIIDVSSIDTTNFHFEVAEPMKVSDFNSHGLLEFANAMACGADIVNDQNQRYHTRPGRIAFAPAPGLSVADTMQAQALADNVQDKILTLFQNVSSARHTIIGPYNLNVTYAYPNATCDYKTDKVGLRGNSTRVHYTLDVEEHILGLGVTWFDSADALHAYTQDTGYGVDAGIRLTGDRILGLGKYIMFDVSGASSTVLEKAKE
jgi:hypothetical protein